MFWLRCCIQHTLPYLAPPTFAALCGRSRIIVSSLRFVSCSASPYPTPFLYLYPMFLFLFVECITQRQLSTVFGFRVPV